MQRQSNEFSSPSFVDAAELVVVELVAVEPVVVELVAPVGIAELVAVAEPVGDSAAEAAAELSSQRFFADYEEHCTSGGARSTFAFGGCSHRCLLIDHLGRESLADESLVAKWILTHRTILLPADSWG